MSPTSRVWPTTTPLLFRHRGFMRCVEAGPETRVGPHRHAPFLTPAIAEAGNGFRCGRLDVPAAGATKNLVAAAAGWALGTLDERFSLVARSWTGTPSGGVKRTGAEGIDLSPRRATRNERSPLTVTPPGSAAGTIWISSGCGLPSPFVSAPDEGGGAVVVDVDLGVGLLRPDRGELWSFQQIPFAGPAHCGDGNGDAVRLLLRGSATPRRPSGWR